MPHIKFNYLYRDSSNYKRFGNVVLANPNNISLEEIEKMVVRNLIDGEFFIAENLSLPTLFFDEPNEDDHRWHEFESIEETNAATILDLKVEDFLNLVQIQQSQNLK